MAIFSGIVLHIYETEVIWIGRLKHYIDNIENLTWHKTPIKSLGVYFYHA